MKFRIHPFVLSRAWLALFAATLLLPAFSQAARAQSISNYERESGRQMLKMIKLDIEKHYYDPTFHGVDLDERFQAADEKIKKATSNGQIFGIIAQALLDFNDSHLFFSPPPRVSRVEYGWQMKAIGDQCYVTAVKPGSDAEAKGLKPGDTVLSVDGFEPSRDVLWKMQYYYYALRPQPGMRLVVQSPGGQPRQVDVLAKIYTGKKQIDLYQYSTRLNFEVEAQNEAHLNRDRFVDSGDLVIWKMPGFDTYDEKDVDLLMDKVKGRKALILDLRGNGGGYVVMLKRLLGHFFDKDIKVSDVKYRKEVKPDIAKTRGGGFKGKLVVLIDSQSGSAAEIFARVIQLEKRGTVIGDRSAGAVMQSLHYGHEVGLETVVPYGASITNADVIMTDGKSLEHTGVTPDELLVPTGADLAAQRDPVLARAAELLGFELNAEKAGALFPIEWRK
ncbi:MAG TPA: S41 family peptidase [Pyrinomonadaceae bacterium]|nr:S41 family peptidase [Pyrinomonadaceae bacterium]